MKRDCGCSDLIFAMSRSALMLASQVPTRYNEALNHSRDLPRAANQGAAVQIAIWRARGPPFRLLWDYRAHHIFHIGSELGKLHESEIARLASGHPHQ